MAVLSRYPLDRDHNRDFTALLWKDLPQANLPPDLTKDARLLQRLSVALDEAKHIVVSDDRAAAAEMARYFAQLGHEHIAFISGPQRYKSSTERMEGFQLGLSAYGIKIRPDWIVEGNNTYETGIECARQLLQGQDIPTAIFANNDQMAAGVLKVAHSLGIKVPEQLSVAGFDDNMLASRVIPALTTIKRPVRQMALLATSKMIMSIENNDKAASNVAAKVAPTLVVRESTARINTIDS